jgi:hypothetical protein
MEAESVFGRRTAKLLLGAFALFAVVVAGLLLLLDWYIDPTKPGERKDLVLTLAQILGGIALFSGLYVTWRTLQVNREGQITERFTRAIDHLANRERLEIRLGGIYALERIARESEQDHWPIMHTLTAYIREHAPWNPEQESSEEEAPSRNFDIQATLTVLGRRPSSFGEGQAERIDLHKTDLREADLKGSNLEGANLAEANLRRVNLEGARLTEANLAEADLRGAYLQGANLQKAVLLRADLRAANLQRANLQDANLDGAKFLRADLAQADISGANLKATRALTPGQINQAHGNEYTQLPDYLEAPPAWRKQPDHRPNGDLAYKDRHP